MSEAHAKNLEQLAANTSQQASQALKEGKRDAYEKMMKHVKELMAQAKQARANGAHDQKMGIKFACDSVPNCEGQIVNRVGSVLVIEGTGADAGSYFAKASLAHRFPSRKQAEDCAKTLGMDAPAKYPEKQELKRKLNQLQQILQFHKLTPEDEQEKKQKIADLEKRIKEFE